MSMTGDGFDGIGIFGQRLHLQNEQDQAEVIRVLRAEVEKGREANRALDEAALIYRHEMQGAREEVERLKRVVAALKNDALASGARYEELWDQIQTLANSEPPPPHLAQLRVERLALVTMDLVGALLAISADYTHTATDFASSTHVTLTEEV